MARPPGVSSPPFQGVNVVVVVDGDGDGDVDVQSERCKRRQSLPVRKDLSAERLKQCTRSEIQI